MVEKSTKQTTRFSNKEMQLMKNTFAERDDLLMVIRRVFLQLGISEKEEVELRTIMTRDLLTVMEKMFNPKLDGYMPLHQEVDLWLTVKIEEKTEEDVLPIIKARKEVIDYMHLALTELAGGKKNPLILKGYTFDLTYINLITRNTIITHVEAQLGFIKMLAGLKNETPDETLARLKQDSSK